jgi:glycosyltransferase involved in cell wall biosynthesis
MPKKTLPKKALPKTFVISLHRSATQSTGQFLHEAGLRMCPWLSGVDGVDTQSQVIGIETDRQAIVDLLAPAIAQFDAFKDVPLPAIFRELDAAYPGSRFIAIYRAPFEWARSAREHCGGRPFDPFERVQYWHYLDDKPASIDDVPDDRLIKMHLRHHQELIEYWRDNFLFANLSDAELGQKLSAFLGVEPRPFPRLDAMPARRAAASAPTPPAEPTKPEQPAPISPTVRSRFHVLGIPHTISASEYTVCAFTQKVVRLCAMLKARGHYVIHYGHKDSQVACDEHVSVTNDDVLRQVYGNHDWRTQGFPPFAIEDGVYQAFNANTIAAISRRKQPGDFLLATFGAGHHVVCGAHQDMVVCEPGIGYPGGQFAPFKVFESYAILHAFYGMGKIAHMDNSFWYDVVIPNYFDLDDFEYSNEKEDYFLFLGRIGPGKGVHIAMQVAEATNSKLVIAGFGSIDGMSTRTSRPIAEYVDCVGVAGVEKRKKLMAKAKGMILPSTYLEPFCGVHVEAMLSGTPVITTDWGAFAEYNLHGVTGYRCRTFEQFVWAAKNIGDIQPAACRDWAAKNFSMERVGAMYDEFFYGVKNVANSVGWYADNPYRTELDWLTKYYPAEAVPVKQVKPRLRRVS